MIARFPLFGTGQPGRSVFYSAQRRVNLFCQYQQEADRSQLSYLGSPGLGLFASFGETPVRGAIQLGDFIYCVHRGTFYSISAAGVTAAIGTLNTATGRVDMAHNGVEIMIVDGTNGYIYEAEAASWTGVIVDGDFFDTCNTVTYEAGRFIYDNDGTGQFGVSASYDGTSHDPNEYATAEAFPDDLVRVFVDHGELILFGDKSLEYWANVGATDFPYSPVQGAVVEYGLAARWSVAKLADSVTFLAQNREGEVSVVMLQGYQPQRISTDDLEQVINTYATVSDASCLSYRSMGHAFYQINFPTAQKSWVFDFNTKLWSELEYGSHGARHRAEHGVEFLNSTYVFDYENGNVYKLDSSLYTDNGEPIVRELIGRHVIDDESVSISRMWLDIETGVNDAPHAMLSVSKDGGHSYGSERWTSLGAIGQYTQRAIWRVLGQAYDWVFKVRISAATKCTISGAWVDAK